MYKSFIQILTLATATGLASEVKPDAVFEKITIEYTLHEDGSQEYRYYKRLKLLTHLSFNRLYGETFVVYNPQSQRLKINLAQTTHTGGKVTSSPENAFNKVLPRFAARAPFYNHLREMVVSHTGTELDAVIELDYVLQTDAGYYPGLMADEILTESSPVTYKEIIVKIPLNRELNYRVFHYRTAPRIEEEGNYRIYRFTFNMIPEDTHESHQPADNLHQPRLIFSTVSWKEATDHVLHQSDMLLKPPTEMSAKLEQIRTESRYDLPFVLKMNELVADEMNHYPVPWQYTGYSARSALKTWNSNGGTDIEKSILFANMLKEGGIHAVPALVVPTALYDEKIGCLPLIREILVQVNPRELEQIYLSAVQRSANNRIFGLGGQTLIALDRQMRKEVVDYPFENKVISNGSFTLDDSLKLSGKVEVLLTEAANPYYRVDSDTASLKSVMGGFSQKVDIGVELINAAQYRSLANISLTFKEPLSNFGDYHLLELPMNTAGTEKWNIRYLQSERVTPFELPGVINEQYSYLIRLPENMRLVNGVELTERNTPFGDLVIYIEQKEQEIVVKKMLVITQKTIEPEAYAAFKEMMDLWNEKNYRRLYIAPK